MLIFVISIVILRLEELSKSLRQTEPYWIVVGIFFYYLNYFFRSKRFISLSNYNISFLIQAINISSIHGMVSYLLPLRSGDLILPIMFKNVAAIEFIQGGKILIKAILLDISILGCFTFFSAFSYPDDNVYFKFFWILLGISMASVFVIIKKIVAVISLYFPKLPAIIYELCKIDKLKFDDIINTFLIWTFVGLSLFAAAKAVGLNLSFSDIWILITIQLPLQLFPVQGIANAGNHEFGWVVALVLLGIDADSALNYALTSHAILIIYVISLVIPAFISFKYLIYKEKKVNV